VLKRNADGRIEFRVRGGVPVLALRIDLLNDGRPDVVSVRGDDLRPLGAVWFTSADVGTFQLQMQVTDACGRVDTTGASRPVEVKP